MKNNKVSSKASKSKASSISLDLTSYNDIEDIIVHRERVHSRKAPERYLDVTFSYEEGTSWEGAIPIEYPRTGTNLSEQSEIKKYLLQAYDYCHPIKRQEWLVEQEEFWKPKKKEETWRLFEILKSFEWACISCKFHNPNWAKRNQDLKEFGYTIGTRLYTDCNKCNKKRTHLILVPLPRGGISGYEKWSPVLRKRIVNLLGSYDVYEGKPGQKENLLPDHKFPEKRWIPGTQRTTQELEALTDEEIRRDFQLMTNQRNLQKREVCRNCFESGIRGCPFGIKFYYHGNEKWPDDVPNIGKDAERGCVGCGWYDMNKWRDALNQKLAESAQNG